MLPLNPARRDEVIEHWAQRIVDQNLAWFAVFMLEAHRPVSTLAAHGVMLAQPVIQPFLHFNMADLASFMGDRENISLLLSRIEQLQLERDQRITAQEQHKRLVRQRARKIARIARMRRQRQPDVVKVTADSPGIQVANIHAADP